MIDANFALSTYIYDLPAELIAQEPLVSRDKSRLLVIDRKQQRITQGVFSDISQYLRCNDVLVLNDTRVIPAKLAALTSRKVKLDVLMVKENTPGVWEALIKPAKKVKLGEVIEFINNDMTAQILAKTEYGGRLLKFSRENVLDFLACNGKAPVPPYIKTEVDDREKYQTVYAKNDGAIAAPTAGFHFTPGLLDRLIAQGVRIVYVTLHCGMATFRPIKTADIRQHKLGVEVVSISQQAAEIINAAKKQNHRIIAVGTTCLRTLESAAECSGRIKPFCGETGLYIVPGYKFKIVDALITNFHTPGSTNLVLVSCFASRQLINKAYQYAIKEKFRFFSFGDATLII
jgi:S-adenosylmethionine:tRNA ribosyltransferase-isomerase